MPDEYSKNWDDLAKQFGFPAEEAESSEPEQEEQNEEVSGDQASTSTSQDAINPEDSAAKESITDFFGSEPESEEPAPAEPEPIAGSDVEQVTEAGEAKLPEGSSAGVEASTDHWGTLADSLGLEADELPTRQSEKALSDIFQTGSGAEAPADEPQSESQREEPASVASSKTFASPGVDEVSANETAETSEAELGEDSSDQEIETVEFEVQDLAPEDENRPRRRRKKRRRRRAVEELREELEREREETLQDEPEPEVDDSVIDEEPDTSEEPEEVVEPAAERETRDSGTRSNRRQRPRDSDEAEEESVSKNRRRRRRRSTRSEDDSESRPAEGQDVPEEDKPAKKFPTWEEAIRPVVDANLNRTSKPKGRRRRRRD